MDTTGQKHSNLKNPRWHTATIMKNKKLQYVCNGLSDFDEIWTPSDNKISRF